MMKTSFNKAFSELLSRFRFQSLQSLTRDLLSLKEFLVCIPANMLGFIITTAILRTAHILEKKVIWDRGSINKLERLQLLRMKR